MYEEGREGRREGGREGGRERERDLADKVSVGLDLRLALGKVAVSLHPLEVSLVQGLGCMG